MYIDDKTRLTHMLDAARLVCEFVQDKKRSDLDIDPMLMHALVNVIEIIGEAASNISDEYRLNQPEIVWSQIIGMRNRLIHGYFDIDCDIVWDTANNYVPILIKQLEKILK